LDEIGTKILRRDGVNIRYRYYTGSSNADPFVFVHGWAGSMEDWMPLVDYYRRQDTACLIFDAPGFGISQFDSKAASRQADFSIERYMQDLAALLDECNFSRVRLIGHSWGGVVAMRFAALYPERVSGLSVIGGAYYDPKNFIHQIFKWVSWLMVWLIVLAKPLLRRYRWARRLAVRRYTFKPLNEQDAELVINDVIASNNLTLEKTLLSGYTVKFKEVCPAIKAPTLYVAGNKDPVAPVFTVMPFVELTPGSKYAELNDCGHFPMQEMPARLITVLGDFWEQL
jgi:pimeloyl-ACP methyl ester carboxylesterase